MRLGSRGALLFLSLLELVVTVVCAFNSISKMDWSSFEKWSGSHGVGLHCGPRAQSSLPQGSEPIAAPATAGALFLGFRRLISTANRRDPFRPSLLRSHQPTDPPRLSRPSIHNASYSETYGRWRPGRWHPWPVSSPVAWLSRWHRMRLFPSSKAATSRRRGGRLLENMFANALYSYIGTWGNFGE